MCGAMRFRLLIAAAAFAAGPALPVVAASHHAATRPEHEAAKGPSELGKFGDWIAARYEHGGQTVCYAFTRAKSAHASGSGGAAMLTVTERAASRDEVALTTSAAYPKGASVTVQVGRAGLDFYTSGADAFARDGRAAVSALRRGGEAIARAPGAHGTDTFSLQGFGPAYDAIVKACPAS
jgi:hypothetical protein